VPFKQPMRGRSITKVHHPLWCLEQRVIYFVLVGFAYMTEVQLSFDDLYFPLSFLSRNSHQPFQKWLCPLVCIFFNFNPNYFIAIYSSFNAFWSLNYFSILSLYILFHLFIIYSIWSSFIWLHFFRGLSFSWFFFNTTFVILFF
jgi:hypothetical protein